MQRIETRLTRAFGLDAPIVSAPMAMAGGGRLAAEVSRAGGLGLIGGGYGDAAWLAAERLAAGNAGVGCGFITWALARQPHLLTEALAHAPRLLMLSFGDPAPFADEIRNARVPLACQCQTIAHVRDALAVGAAIVVAQGAEAGGHGGRRATLTLVPEAADLIAREAPGTLLLAAGGIADGRGLAAALMLGADGVLMGTRFWASAEALVPAGFHAAALAADGDATVRTRVPDVARRLDWPDPFTVRALASGFVGKWHGREAALAEAIETEAPAYAAALAAGDPEGAGVLVGEAVGLIGDAPPAAEIVRRTVAEAAALLSRASGYLAA